MNSFWISIFSFITGAGFAFTFSQNLITRAATHTESDLKDAKSEVLRLRTQVANLIGKE